MQQIGAWRIIGTITTVAGTPKTAIQYAASSSNNAEVLYFSVSQSGSTTSAMDRVQLISKSAAATVTAGVAGTASGDTVLDLSNGSGTFHGTLSTTGTGVNASSEGTDAAEFKAFNFNVLAGYEWNSQPNGRLWVPASGIIALKLKAVVAETYDCEMIVVEYK